MDSYLIFKKIVDFSIENYILIILVFIGLMILYHLWIRLLYRNRIRYALRFGRIEHFSGRLLGVSLIFTILIFFLNEKIVIIPLLISFMLWLIYLFSHNMEKRLYPNNFRF